MRSDSAMHAETALGTALGRAGYMSPQDRLVAKAREALALEKGKFEAAKKRFASLIRNEPTLLWELFANERDTVLGTFIKTVHEAGRIETVGRNPDLASGVGQISPDHKVPERSASPTRPFSPPSVRPLTVAPVRAAPSPTPQATRQPGQPRNPALRMQPSKLDAWKPAVVNAMEDERRRSKLYTFLVNGKPLAEVTAAEARGWAKSHERDSRFVRLMVDQVPDAMLVGDCRTAEEAEKLYRQAEENGRGE